MRLGDFSALTFDCYGTLIDWETGILAALRPWTAAHGVEADDEELLAAFGRAESRREATDPTAPYPRILAGVLEDLAEELGTTASPEEAAAFGDSVKDWPVFADSPEALAYLQRHYKLVIVSNVDRASFRQSNAKLGVTFDAVVTADDAGAYKPAHNHFQLALAQLAEMGVAQGPGPARRPEPVPRPRSAQQLGLRTMWVNRRAAHGRDGGATPAAPVPVTPDGEVPTLAALAEPTARSAPVDPPPADGYRAPPGPHRLGPTNASSRATLPRLATDRLYRLFGRHSIPSWSHARPKIPRMSADTLLKWYRG